MKVCSLCGVTELESRIIKSEGGLVCKKCYGRIRRSKEVYPLPNYGEVAYSPDGKPICHICGRAYDKPLTHVWAIHGLSEKEYKSKFGLDVSYGILSESSRKLASRRAYENYSKVVEQNLLTKGAKTRFKKGSPGRVKEKVSEQTRRALIERLNSGRRAINEQKYGQCKTASKVD